MKGYHKKNEIVLVVGNEDNLSRCLAGEQGFMQGFKRIVTCCAQEAFQTASKYPKIEMLLTDLLLDNNYLIPEKNGVQFAQEFASKYPKTKIVFMIP